MLLVLYRDPAIRPANEGSRHLRLCAEPRTVSRSRGHHTVGVHLADPSLSAFNTYVNPIALAAITWKYYTVYIATLSVVLVIIYFYFPEIKGLTLDEISLVFDKGNRGGSSDRQAAADQLAANDVVKADGQDKAEMPHEYIEHSRA